MGFYNTFGRHYSSNRGAGSAKSTSAKVMSAKFAGICADCGASVRAGQTIRFDGKAHHLNADHCNAAKMFDAAQQDARDAAATAGSAFRGPVQAAAPALDLAPLVAFLTAAKAAGLKFPKVRVLHMDGKREIALGLTATGRNPGSVSVKIDGEYIGLVTPAGQPTGMVAASANADLRAHLVAVAAAPAVAAKAYAVLKCCCSFCGDGLTDEGSIEVGYGPKCAKNYGLPHKPKGTKAPVAVASQAEAA
jgi:hypothetical protein